MILSPVVTAASDGEIIRVGEGSYATSRPEACEPLPEQIYTSKSIQGATPTNQWWSSLVWAPHSDNMFPHPLGMVCYEGGLSVSYPGAAIVAAGGNIMGGGVSKKGDVIIGHSATEKFPDARLADYSQWFITAEFADGDSMLRCTFGHGSPFVYCRISGGKPCIRFSEKPVLWATSDKGNVIGITVRGNHYGLFGAEGSEWNDTDGANFTNENAKDYFSLALLPDNQTKTLALFARYAHNHIVTTEAIPSVEPGYIETTYRITTKAMERSEKGTIFALYPHQWKYSDTDLNGMTYLSVRGAMKVAEGNGFKTRSPIQGVLPMLPPEGIPSRDRMLGYLQKEASKKVKGFGDTYWEGKHLGKLATLSGIAETTGAAELQQEFVEEIKSRLENWFTALPGEGAPLFYYDGNWGSLIGSRPSYGSDSQLNDHHFHYGYFIRAAAEVARVDPEWAEDWGPMVELLIRDIASSDRQDSMFPEIRCFDIYAGHSWASGHARFGDGNNQESSSESLNAWYGMMLWGGATANQSIRDTGAYLYNTERTAVEEYWFDVSGTNFPDDFPNVALGMIWGGKGAFATWFSGEIDHVHGINWLPFTPASIYMGRFPDYVKINHDRIVERREDGSDYNNGWGDLIVMFNALSDPASAAEYFDTNPECMIEGGNTHAFMYHWIHTLKRLGINDASVTADHPFVNVYTKGGKKSYAVYNFNDTPLKVRFSDRKTVVAAPHGLTLTTSANH